MASVGSVRLEPNPNGVVHEEAARRCRFRDCRRRLRFRSAAYKAPRTPWGDPDLSGVYSNDDETGTPLERPAVFEGRRLEDITPAEMKKLNQERTEQFNAGVAGTEFAGGLRPPTHLIFDSFERRNNRAWLVTDPPDGKIPALTQEGQQRLRRPQRGVSTNANPVGPFNSYEDMGLYDRCITRGIPELDDAGRLRQQLHDRAGTGISRQSATR